MRRRDLIALAAGAAAWPALLRAQQPTMPVIGFLNVASPGPFAPLVAAFHEGLSETGFVEGRNLRVEYRWADGDQARLPYLAADLAAMPVAAIAATGRAAADAAVTATKTIPIVFSGTDNVLRTGAVASLNHPGGNVTGVAIGSPALLAKALQLLAEVTKRDAPLAVLIDPTLSDVDVDKATVTSGARQIGREIFFQQAGQVSDLEPAFAAMVERRAAGVAVQLGAFFTNQRERIVDLAQRHALPAIYQLSEFAAAGGLMSYGHNLADVYRQVGNYIGRILHGAKPEELPVVLPLRYRFTINLKTAKALGLTIPPPLLILADEVVE